MRSTTVAWHFFWRAIEYWVDGDLYEFINLKSSATIGIATPATNFHHCSDGEGDEEMQRVQAVACRTQIFQRNIGNGNVVFSVCV